MFAFPQTRWAFSHWRELLPTTAVRRAGAVSPLPRAERQDIDSIPFTALDGRSLTWADSLDANYTDGIIVLHKGRIIYERYRGALGPDGQHIAFSVTKSFVGLLAEMLIAEGRLDPALPIQHYVPELAASGYADATVRQAMDMRVGVAFDEAYGGTDGDVFAMSLAGGVVPRPAGYAGPDGVCSLAAQGWRSWWGLGLSDPQHQCAGLGGGARVRQAHGNASVGADMGSDGHGAGR